jgi:hypothetical protein
VFSDATSGAFGATSSALGAGSVGLTAGLDFITADSLLTGAIAGCSFDSS